MERRTYWVCKTCGSAIEGCTWQVDFPECCPKPQYERDDDLWLCTLADRIHNEQPQQEA